MTRRLSGLLTRLRMFGMTISNEAYYRNMELSIDHLGIAVKSLAAAKGIYEKLGLSVSPEETV